MAAVIRVLEGGDMEVQIRGICADNMASVIEGESLEAVEFAPMDSDLARFRRAMNFNFAQLNLQLVVAGLVDMGEGDSWYKCRDILKANWALVDAVVNP